MKSFFLNYLHKLKHFPPTLNHKIYIKAEDERQRNQIRVRVTVLSYLFKYPIIERN